MLKYFLSAARPAPCAIRLRMLRARSDLERLDALERQPESEAGFVSRADGSAEGRLHARYESHFFKRYAGRRADEILAHRAIAHRETEVLTVGCIRRPPRSSGIRQSSIQCNL